MSLLNLGIKTVFKKLYILQEFRKNTDPFRTEKIELLSYEVESNDSFDMTGTGRFVS